LAIPSQEKRGNETKGIDRIKVFEKWGWKNAKKSRIKRA